jgi:GNAT superfamily N-acetyltransferase
MIRELTRADLPWVESVVSRHFASPRVVSRGRIHLARDLPGFVAEWKGLQSGLLLYRWAGEEIELVVLISERPRRGIAGRLVERLRQMAKTQGCRRLWLVTTNDNREAIAFYHATGWQQGAVHRGAARDARRLKPEIPEVSRDGIPIEDEIEFEIEL